MAGFKSSFAAARKAGKKTFTWEGKKYTTELASSKAPKASAKPAAKPAARGGSTSANNAREMAAKAGARQSAAAADKDKKTDGRGRPITSVRGRASVQTGTLFGKPTYGTPTKK